MGKQNIDEMETWGCLSSSVKKVFQSIHRTLWNTQLGNSLQVSLMLVLQMIPYPPTVSMSSSLPMSLPHLPCSSTSSPCSFPHPHIGIFPSPIPISLPHIPHPCYAQAWHMAQLELSWCEGGSSIAGPDTADTGAGWDLDCLWVRYTCWALRATQGGIGVIQTGRHCNYVTLDTSRSPRHASYTSLCHRQHQQHWTIHDTLDHLMRRN